MGSRSEQGVAILVFLVAFTILGAALFRGGSLVLLVVFLIGAGASVALFRKAKVDEPPAKWPTR